MWVARVALQRPDSFVVLALLIAIFGVLAALNAPTDIFPSLNIPVVSVVWTDNGLLPNDVSGRDPASPAHDSGRAANQVLRRWLSALNPPRAVWADVLRRRPAVAQAERLTAAREQIGASRNNFFPKFTFLALGGTQDTNFRLFNPRNLFGTIGPSIDIPRSTPVSARRSSRSPKHDSLRRQTAIGPRFCAP